MPAKFSKFANNTPDAWRDTPVATRRTQKYAAKARDSCGGPDKCFDPDCYAAESHREEDPLWDPIANTPACDTEVCYWRACKRTHKLGQHQPGATPPPGTLCRKGKSCATPKCIFTHPEGHEVCPDNSCADDACTKSHMGWCVQYPICHGRKENSCQPCPFRHKPGRYNWNPNGAGTDKLRMLVLIPPPPA
jgi:hypothetical protein